MPPPPHMEWDYFEKLGSNSLLMLHNFVSKNPLDVPPKLDIIYGPTPAAKLSVKFLVVAIDLAV